MARYFVLQISSIKQTWSLQTASGKEHRKSGSCFYSFQLEGQDVNTALRKITNRAPIDNEIRIVGFHSQTRNFSWNNNFVGFGKTMAEHATKYTAKDLNFTRSEWV